MADDEVRQKATTPEALALSWLQRDGACRLIVDDMLRIVWASDAAREALAPCRDLEVRDGYLSVTNQALYPTLLGFVRSCSADMASLCLPADGGDAHILLRGHALHEAGSPPRVGVTFHRTGRDFTARYVGLDRIFQLTQAEHRVLRLLLDGSTADEAARMLNVSIETTRSHIRHIYAKMNVTSREGLFSRVRPFQV